MKLIICTMEHGHLTMEENDVVKTGKYAGLDQRKLFEKIMQEGYGNKVPAHFFADFKDGTTRKFTGKGAAGLLDNTDVDEVTIIAPIMGG